MLRIACFFTGDNYQLLTKDTPASKKKVIAMAVAISLPVMIWIFSSLMLSLEVLENSLGWSVITAIGCGLIIFIIEKLIVMANGNGWLTVFRVSIGLIIAGLGSIAIDEVVFKNDINTSVAKIKKDAVLKAKMEASSHFEKETGYPELEKRIIEAKNAYEKAEQAVIDEANGTYGTGRRGAGKITELKNNKALDRKNELDKLIAQKAALAVQKMVEINKAGEDRTKTFDDRGLLVRVKALFALVREDGYMLIVYLLFTTLLFFFEFLVVILKLTWRKTNYERKLEMIEEIGNMRMGVLLNKNNQMDPGSYLPQLDAASIAVKRNSAIYN